MTPFVVVVKSNYSGILGQKRQVDNHSQYFDKT